MLDQTETSITVRRVVSASTPALFAVLRDPRRHAEIDGSGMVQADDGAQPGAAVGDVFTLKMHRADQGDYRTDNHVLEYEPDHKIVWTTGRSGQPPAGQRWSWELTPNEDGGTTVEHVYDWSGITDPAVLARGILPRVSPADLRTSVANLVIAAS